jgi:hypothetical protein
MTEQTIETRETAPDAEQTETDTPQWTTPDFSEQSACAEFCAYVFAD